MSEDLSYRLFINGKWLEASSDETLSVINPATEAEIGVVPQATVADAQAAIRAARAAFDDGPWGRSTPMERAAVILRMAYPLGVVAQVLERRAHLQELREQPGRAGLGDVEFDELVPPALEDIWRRDRLRRQPPSGSGQGILLRADRVRRRRQLDDDLAA